MRRPVVIMTMLQKLETQAKVRVVGMRPMRMEARRARMVKVFLERQ